MGKPKAPTPPDPKQTSAAQTGTNISTTIANTIGGQVNQVGPDGSTLTYGQTGNYKWKDPYTGMDYDVPTFTATTKLSPEAQNIFNIGQQTKTTLAEMGRDQSAFVKDYMSKPWEADTSQVEKYLFDKAKYTLDPKFEQQRADLETRLSNQGIKLGSAAYDRAMDGLRQSQGATYNDYALRGNQQGFQQMQAIRNQPLNEILAFLNGGGVQMPNYSISQPSTIPTTDNAGLINANFGQKQQNYQNEMASWNDIMGGLFGLGSAGITGYFGGR